MGKLIGVAVLLVLLNCGLAVENEDLNRDKRTLPVVLGLFAKKFGYQVESKNGFAFPNEIVLRRTGATPPKKVGVVAQVAIPTQQAQPVANDQFAQIINQYYPGNVIQGGKPAPAPAQAGVFFGQFIPPAGFPASQAPPQPASQAPAPAAPSKQPVPQSPPPAPQQPVAPPPPPPQKVPEQPSAPQPSAPQPAPSGPSQQPQDNQDLPPFPTLQQQPQPSQPAPPQQPQDTQNFPPFPQFPTNFPGASPQPKPAELDVADFSRKAPDSDPNILPQSDDNKLNEQVNYGAIDPREQDIQYVQVPASAPQQSSAPQDTNEQSEVDYEELYRLAIQKAHDQQGSKQGYEEVQYQGVRGGNTAQNSGAHHSQTSSQTGFSVGVNYDHYPSSRFEDHQYNSAAPAVDDHQYQSGPVYQSQTNQYHGNDDQYKNGVFYKQVSGGEDQLKNSGIYQHEQQYEIATGKDHYDSEVYYDAKQPQIHSNGNSGHNVQNIEVYKLKDLSNNGDHLQNGHYYQSEGDNYYQVSGGKDQYDGGVIYRSKELEYHAGGAAHDCNEAGHGSQTRFSGDHYQGNFGKDHQQIYEAPLKTYTQNFVSQSHNEVKGHYNQPTGFQHSAFKAPSKPTNTYLPPQPKQGGGAVSTSHMSFTSNNEGFKFSTVHQNPSVFKYH